MGISRYNEKALWRHQNIAAIDLLGNKLKRIPTTLYLPALNYLHVGENNIRINVPLHRKQFPSLLYLYLNGNDLVVFPDASLKAVLLEFGVARCHLTSLPS